MLESSATFPSEIQSLILGRGNKFLIAGWRLTESLLNLANNTRKYRGDIRGDQVSERGNTGDIRSLGLGSLRMAAVSTAS